MTDTFWNEVYGEKSESERSWSDEALDEVWIMVDELGLAHDEPIIDVGAGSARFLEGLLARGFTDLTALDLSDVALAEARKRLASSTSMSWIVRDVTLWEPTRQYALWRDRATFHFLTNESSQRQYRNVARRAIRSNGFLLLSTFALDGPTTCSGLEVQRWGTDEIAAFMHEDFSLLSSERRVHVTPWGSEQAFNTWLFERRA
ncbi:MAG TPA: class I SAM-dependent methyltransferase [Acidimicrobiales bacterium]|nr:MAG: hypothetical protein B7X07_02725 [Actinobacteria bacterium 21-64-8]HQU00446.1 class I SAM-dependent methyltransferase [Acidimicrobiales bacterium]